MGISIGSGGGDKDSGFVHPFIYVYKWVCSRCVGGMFERWGRGVYNKTVYS